MAKNWWSSLPSSKGKKQVTVVIMNPPGRHAEANEMPPMQYTGDGNRHSRAGVLQTQHGPIMVHKGEGFIQQPDGSTIVVPSGALKKLQQVTGMRGASTGYDDANFPNETPDSTGRVRTNISTVTMPASTSGGGVVTSTSSFKPTANTGLMTNGQPFPTAQWAPTYTGKTTAFPSSPAVPIIPPSIALTTQSQQEVTSPAGSTSPMSISLTPQTPQIATQPVDTNLTQQRIDNVINRQEGWASGNSLIDRQIANTTLGNLASRNQWQTLATKQQLAENPYQTAAGADATLGMLGAQQNANMANTAGTLAINSQDRAYNANQALYPMLTGERANEQTMTETERRYTTEDAKNMTWNEFSVKHPGVSQQSYSMMRGEYGPDYERTQRINDAKSMTETAWIGKYGGTHEDYLAAQGSTPTPESLYNLWSTNFTNLMNDPNTPIETLKAQWALAKNNPAFAPYMATMVEPNWTTLATTRGTGLDTIVNNVIKFAGSKVAPYANSPTFKQDMTDFVWDVLSGGGSISANGAITLGPDSTASMPWDDPRSFFRYTDWDGKDIADNVDVTSPAWLDGTITVDGKQITRRDIQTFWTGLSADDQISSQYTDAYGNPDPVKIARAYAVQGSGQTPLPGGTMPTTRVEFGDWLEKPENAAAKDLYETFRDGLESNPITIIGADGKSMEVNGGEPDLPWIWAQLQQQVHGGDYTKPLNSANVGTNTFKLSADGTITRATVGDSVENRLTLSPLNDNHLDRWRIPALEPYASGDKTGPFAISLNGKMTTVEYVGGGFTPKGGRQANDWSWYVVKNPATGQYWRIRAEGDKLTYTDVTGDYQK